MLLYAEIVFAIFSNVISQILYYWLNLSETLQCLCLLRKCLNLDLSFCSSTSLTYIAFTVSCRLQDWEILSLKNNVHKWILDFLNNPQHEINWKNKSSAKSTFFYLHSGRSRNSCQKRTVDICNQNHVYILLSRMAVMKSCSLYWRK